MGAGSHCLLLMRAVVVRPGEVLVTPRSAASCLRSAYNMPTVVATKSTSFCRHFVGMARTNPLGVRVTPEIKEALERAARDDDRSVSSMVERILSVWLRERGYLPQPAE